MAITTRVAILNFPGGGEPAVADASCFCFLLGLSLLLPPAAPAVPAGVFDPFSMSAMCVCVCVCIGGVERQRGSRSRRDGCRNLCREAYV